MFDLDAFIDECVDARAETEPRVAMKAALRRALAEPHEIGDALPMSRAGIQVLHRSPELTVLQVVWPPKMAIYPHDHRMWAAIGIYTGQEDNTFYRRGGEDGAGRSTLVESGGRELHTGDVFLLGDDAIHGVTNPCDRYTAAIHIYGGDLIGAERSQWGPGPLVERPYDVVEAQRQYTDADAAWSAASQRA